MNRETLEKLRQLVATAPEEPGVYLHYDSAGEVLYVGKARNLRNRLRSYFTSVDRHPPKTHALVERIVRFEVIMVRTESEALILENNLIKHHRPPYNILLRDDRSFPYLRIDLREDWPTVVEIRRRKDDGARYFGPYVSGNFLFFLKLTIRRFFPLRKCSLAVFRAAKRPCNYHAIGQCMGPCALPVDRAEYQRQIDSVISLLEGKTDELERKLREEMGAASAELNFERAALLRDQLAAVKELSSHQQSVTLVPGLDLDYIGSYRKEGRCCFFIGHMRDGRVIGGEHCLAACGIADPGFASEEGEDLKENESTNEKITFLCQFYQPAYREIPRYIILSSSTMSLDHQSSALLTEFLTSLSKEARSDLEFIGDLKALQRRRDKASSAVRDSLDGIRSLLKQADENAVHRAEEEARVDMRARGSLEAVQQFIGLDKLPERVECYDISTFHGTETVASQVVFMHGQPQKSQYRIYQIREHVRTDDFAALREVMQRRFREEKRGVLPDLMIIDGGEPQVREVGWVLKSLGLEQLSFVGLAKARVERSFSDAAVHASSERIVLPARDSQGNLRPNDPVETRVLRTGTPEYRLFTRIRDEAHRSAITAHRKRRDRVSRTSLLHRVPGLGPKRRKSLLEAFPDPRVLPSVSASEIAERAKIPLALAEEIRRRLGEN